MRKAEIYTIAIFAYLIFTTACAELDSELQNNPDKGTEQTDALTLLHREVLLPDCAVSGCHDGHFEPDFRSVQSTFNTTVYHPVVKNNQAGTFEFRVVPGDTTSSVLYERVTNCCFVNEDDRMPQLDIGEALPDEKISLISKWILSGAPNVDGYISEAPQDH